MRLELFTGKINKGSFIRNPKPIAAVTTSPQGIQITGDASYFEDFSLDNIPFDQQDQVLKDIADRFSSISMIQTRLIDEKIEKKMRQLPARLFPQK